MTLELLMAFAGGLENTIRLDDRYVYSASGMAYHRRFAEHRLHGEWFSPAPELLAEIERLSSLPQTTGDAL